MERQVKYLTTFIVTMFIFGAFLLWLTPKFIGVMLDLNSRVTYVRYEVEPEATCSDQVYINEQGEKVWCE